jgi:glycerol-3-phosphate dehydrogenase (NAD(P)+)
VKIGVVGGGAWGTALAQVAAAGGEEVLLWALEPEVVESVNGHHENLLYLAGLKLSPSLHATGDLAALGWCEALLLVSPAQHLRAVLGRLPVTDRPMVLCSKGIEEGSGKLMTEVAAEVQPEAPIAVMSGPSFAHEVAAGLPAALTLATADAALGARLTARLARPHFRTYYSDDVIGAEVGGAVKNVIAIACGVVEGLRLGLNARAALIARGFAEMTRFGLAKGGRAETLAGLAGLGDLVLTCSSTESRNFSLGKGLGEGARAANLLADRRTVAEGAFTAPVLQRAAAELGVEMPIVDAVCALLADVPVKDVVTELLARPLRSEGV